MSLEAYYARLPRRVVSHTIVTFNYTSASIGDTLELGSELCHLSTELEVLKVVRYGTCRACMDMAVIRGLAHARIVVTSITVL